MQIHSILIRTTAAVAAALALASSALAQDRVPISIADYYTIKHVISVEGVSYWMKRATELSRGKIEFKYFPAEQMAKANSLLQAIRTGVADGGAVCVAFTSDKMPLSSVTMLPGLTRTAHEGSLAYWKAVQSGVLREEFSANELVPMFAFMFPSYQFLYVGKPLHRVEEFKGRKLRTPGSSMNLMVQSLGSTPVTIPPPDAYLAFERRTVDGTFLSLVSIKSYNLQEVVKSVSVNGSFGNSPCVYAMNAKRFASLPQDVKDTLRQAGEDTVKHMAGALDGEADQARVDLTKAGVELYSFTDAELAALNKALLPVTDDWIKRIEARKLPARQALKEFTAAVSAVR